MITLAELPPLVSVESQAIVMQGIKRASGAYYGDFTTPTAEQLFAVMQTTGRPYVISTAELSRILELEAGPASFKTRELAVKCVVSNTAAAILDRFVTIYETPEVT